jgi:hypothetical protein
MRTSPESSNIVIRKWERPLKQYVQAHLAMQHGSPNAADPAVTTRVITVLLADEY